MRQWYGRDAKGFQQFATAFDADERGVASAGPGLVAIAGDAGQPPIVRASALERLARHPSAAAIDVATRNLGNGDPLVRRAALRVLEVLPPRERLVALPLLGDRVRAVRLEAVRVLAPAAASIIGVGEREHFRRVTDEFIASQRFNADRPEARTSLGTFLAQLGRGPEAIEEYRAAIRFAPNQVPAYVNLADAYAQRSAEPRAEEVLRDGLAHVTQQADLHHALGLSLARSKRLPEAVEELARASALAPDVARFSYAHAVALHSTGRADQAVQVVETARRRHPADRDLLYALATFQRDAGRTAAALRAAEELTRLFPDDSEAAALRQSLATGLRR